MFNPTTSSTTAHVSVLRKGDDFILDVGLDD